MSHFVLSQTHLSIHDICDMRTCAVASRDNQKVFIMICIDLEEKYMVNIADDWYLSLGVLLRES